MIKINKISDYEIIKILGNGAMGQVYLGRKTNNLYAIKQAVFSPLESEEQVFLKLFLREAKLLKNILHPGIPKYYESFKYGNEVYIIMEYIEGKSLEDILKETSNPIEENRIIQWGIELCEIFFYLHTLKPQPVIYRDLKPANIIITPEDTVRLIDFGVARYYNPGKQRDTMRFGTPGYAAPEQYIGPGQSTPRSDIYALGVVLHRLLTSYDPAKSPFKLPHMRSLRPDLSIELEWIVQKAINREQKDRYLDMELFMEELKDYYEENYFIYISPYRKQIIFLESEGKIIPQKPGNSSFTFLNPLGKIYGFFYSIWHHRTFLEKIPMVIISLCFILFFLSLNPSVMEYINPFYFFAILTSFIISYSYIKSAKY